MWSETWKKGQRPLEAEVVREHTWERCNEIKNHKTKRGWLKRMCECGVDVWYSRKHYCNDNIPDVCDECKYMNHRC